MRSPAKVFGIEIEEDRHNEAYAVLGDVLKYWGKDDDYCDLLDRLSFDNVLFNSPKRYIL